MTYETIAKSLDEYRIKNGTHWKRKLKDFYFSGKCHDTNLKLFKKHFSFDTLDKIKYHTTKREIIALMKKEMAA